MDIRVARRNWMKAALSGFFVLCLDVDLANPHRYRQRAMVLLNKVLHHTWSSTNHASWIEKNQQCPTTTKGSFRHVFKTPGALLPPAATQELYRHYDWNDDDSAAFMTAAYYVVAEFVQAGLRVLKGKGDALPVIQQLQRLLNGVSSTSTPCPLGMV